jgi:mannosyltransferase OCH1-like enzyme
MKVKRTVLINGKIVEKEIKRKKMVKKKLEKKVQKNGREKAKTKVPNIPKKNTFHLDLLEKLTNTLQDTRLDAVQPATEPGTMSKTVFRISLGPYQTDFSAVQHTTEIMGKEWTTVIVDDNKADMFWNTYFPVDHMIRTAYYMIHPKFGASRANILRLALVYIHGGMYLDFKSSVLQVPPSLSEHKQLGVCQWPAQIELFPNGEFTNWFILGKSGSPVLWMALVHIAKMVHYLHSNQNILNLVTEIADADSISKRLVLTVTGSIAFTFVLQKYLKYVECSYLPYVEYDFTKKHQAGKNHYSMQSHTEYLLNWTNKRYNIPRTLYMTYKNIKSIPPAVIRRAQTLHPELTFCFFDNDQCRQFLTEYFPAIVLYTFDSLKLGAHKADLWRYCILYVRGGFYCDVKTDFVCSLLEFVTEEDSKTWYTVIGYEGVPKQLYNGIIITPPFNPILYECIEFMCKNKSKDYHYNVKYLYASVQAQVDHTLRPGFNKMKNGWSVYLAKETCVKNMSKRYNLECTIRNHQNKTLVNTRCDGFGMGTHGWL